MGEEGAPPLRFIRYWLRGLLRLTEGRLMVAGIVTVRLDWGKLRTGDPARLLLLSVV